MLDKIFVDADVVAVVAARFASFTDHRVSHIVSVEPYNENTVSVLLSLAVCQSCCLLLFI